jgi:hypothetical protein
MISSKDLNSEVNVLQLKAEKTPDKVTLGDVVKVGLLVLKVVRDMRTNQVSLMREQYGDKLFVKPVRPHTSGKPEARPEVKK